jgi:hypothetical protein
VLINYFLCNYLERSDEQLAEEQLELDHLDQLELELALVVYFTLFNLAYS